MSDFDESKREAREVSEQPAESESAVAEPHEASAGESAPADEAEVLRGELARLQEQLSEANARLEEMKDRYVRARADLENFRKRTSAEAERAREAGLDSAVLPVLSVFDDLHRALSAAEGSDPAQIVPGVQSVLATLERNVEALGIKPVGRVGDSFDPDLHEALTSIPTSDSEKSETIAEVFQLGFQKGERLIRPARVVVYQS
jgi:molecular chaperone GrpE